MAVRQAASVATSTSAVNCPEPPGRPTSQGFTVEPGSPGIAHQETAAGFPAYAQRRSGIALTDGRLLVVYLSLLDRRPVIPARAASYIENQLLVLAAKKRLQTAQHWELWSGAVGAMDRSRVSQRMKRFVQAQLHKKDLSEQQRKALEPLRAMVAE